MTPNEGFEIQWPFLRGSIEMNDPGEQHHLNTWLAACQFQRERDAELVEHHVNGPGPLRAQLAAAIREGG